MHMFQIRLMNTVHRGLLVHFNIQEKFQIVPIAWQRYTVLLSSDFQILFFIIMPIEVFTNDQQKYCIEKIWIVKSLNATDLFWVENHAVVSAFPCTHGSKSRHSLLSDLHFYVGSSPNVLKSSNLTTNLTQKNQYSIF